MTLETDTISVDTTGNGTTDTNITTGFLKLASGVDGCILLGDDDDQFIVSPGRVKAAYGHSVPNATLTDGIDEGALFGITSNYRGNLGGSLELDNINAGVIGRNSRGLPGGLKVGVYGLCNDHWQSIGVLGEGSTRLAQADNKSSSWSGVFRYRPFLVGDPYNNASGGWTEGRIVEWENAGSAPGHEYATLIAFPYEARSAHSANDSLRGRVGIRTWSPDYELDVTGTIRATSNVIAYSDIRKKENIVTINDGLSIVEQLRGVRFDWKEGFQSETATDKGKRQIGLIAQEVEDILPELVSTDIKGFKSLSYSNLSAVLVEAIKDLKGIVDKQQEEINKLKEIIRE